MNPYNPIPAIIALIAVALVLAAFSTTYAMECHSDSECMLLCALGSDCDGRSGYE